MENEKSVLREECFIMTFSNKDITDWINANYKDWGRDIAFSVLVFLAEKYPEIRKILGAEVTQ